MHVVAVTAVAGEEGETTRHDLLMWCVSILSGYGLGKASLPKVGSLLQRCCSRSDTNIFRSRRGSML